MERNKIMSDPVYDKEIVATCDVKHLSMIRKMVQEVAVPCFQDKMIVGRIVLAVDEAVANVMEHAYDGMSEGDVHVRIWVEDEFFKVTVTDEGNKFDPSAAATPDLKAAVENGNKSGYGIYLIRQIMDEIHYNYVKNVRNELCMIKKIPDTVNG